ncbi:hypothetical protein RRG08_025089 [Elysia crispata]|uniref:Uncharacterized protein n=1 Tax=Elysia crispata TaxID=231223 RepID=A0AAE1AIM4_9GAST|nr:hypothetical protein RRG08_025089 [Elysia crispata]
MQPVVARAITPCTHVVWFSTVPLASCRLSTHCHWLFSNCQSWGSRSDMGQSHGGGGGSLIRFGETYDQSFTLTRVQPLAFSAYYTNSSFKTATAIVSQ